METPTLIAAVAFATVTSITPGPNNLMLLASGVNYGFRASVPHMLGISAGFLVLLLAVGLGMGALLQRWPGLYLGLKLLGMAYMVWLAWRLWRAEAPASPEQGHQALATPGNGPLGFWGAAAFQWVNPKAWMMALGAMAAFVGPQAAWSAVGALALLFAAINLPCISLWALAGAKLSRWLAQPERRRAFNTAMALALMLTIWPIVV